MVDYDVNIPHQIYAKNIYHSIMMMNNIFQIGHLESFLIISYQCTVYTETAQLFTLYTSESIVVQVQTLVTNILFIC